MGWSWKKTWRNVVRPVTATIVSNVILDLLESWLALEFLKLSEN